MTKSNKLKSVNAVFVASVLIAAPVPARADIVADIFQGVFGARPAPAGAQSLAPSRRAQHGHRPHVAAGEFSAVASWYGGGPRSLEPNSRTASGEHFNRWGLTAAHRTLPMGTRLLVSYRGKTCVVRVNDRGPASWTGRSLDLSRGAATQLGLIRSGTGRVSVAVLGG